MRREYLIRGLELVGNHCNHTSQSGRTRISFFLPVKMASVERTVSDSSENSRSFQFVCHPLPSPDSSVGTSILPFLPSKVLQPTKRLDHTCESRLQNQSDLLPSPRAGLPEASRFVHPRSAPGDCGTALPAPVLVSPISPKRPVMDRPENLEAKTVNDQIHSSTTTALSDSDVSKPVKEVIPPETNFGVTQFQPTLETSRSPLPAAPPVHVSHLRARHLQNLAVWSLPPAASSTPDNAHSQQNMEGTEYWVKQTGPVTLEESSSQRSDRSTSSARSALQKLQTSACLGFGPRSPDHLLDSLSSRNGSAFGENTGTGSPPADSSIDRPSTWLSRVLKFERLGFGDSSKVGKRNSGSPPSTVDPMNKVDGMFAGPRRTKLVDDNLEAIQGQQRKDGKRKSERMRSHRWLSKLRWRLKSSAEDESLGSVIRRQVPPDHEQEHEISLSRAGSARLNSMKKPSSSTKRAVNHKRSMSWASANLSTPFTPQQPRLAMRDAQELLMPPKKLPVATSDPADSQKALKGKKLSTINTQTKELNARVSAKENDLATQEPCEPLPAADVEVDVPPALSEKTGDCLDFSAAEFHRSQCAPREGDVQESKNLKPALSWDQPVKSPMSPTTSTEVSQQEFLVQSREVNSITNAECVASTMEVDVNGTSSSVHKDDDAWEGDILETPVEDVIVKHTVCEEAPSGNAVSTFSNPSIDVSDSDHYNLKQARSGYSRLTESMNGPNSLSPISFEDIIAGGSASASDNILLRFFFKCREVEDLNKFLRLQKSRLLSASKSEFDECFHLIFSSANSGM